MTEIDQRFMRAVQQARMAAPGGQLRHDPLRRTPERPCADGDPDMSLPPAASVMTSARLAQARSRSAREYYPPIARYYDIEGVVTVRVLTSASGCVVSADLQTSSGNELLDDAALDWVVEGAAFEPATDAGLAPIPSIVVLNVRFDLTG